MIPITVNELITFLQKCIAEDKQNGDLPCYIFPEGGQDILLENEIWIQKADFDTVQGKARPKRLLIG